MQNTKIKEMFKKRLYEFTLRLIRLIESLPKDTVSRRMGDQLIRSGTSIIANYVEGQSGSSRKDFANFLNHALKSNNETKLWIALLRDSKKIEATKAQWFLEELNEYGKIFGKSLVTLRKKR